MSRRVVAAVCVAGATVPLALAAVFLFGCCALPFHGVIHRVMPLCEMAASMIRGDRAAGAHDQTPLPPAREKQEPARRIATVVPAMQRLAVANSAAQALTPSPSTAYRSFITLGAARCDRDVGLHVLDDTFRI